MLTLTTPPEIDRSYMIELRYIRSHNDKLITELYLWTEANVIIWHI